MTTPALGGIAMSVAKKRKGGLVGRLGRERRGQAMVAYALITALLLGTVSVVSMKFLPEMLDAYDTFTRSLYFSINAPLP